MDFPRWFYHPKGLAFICPSEEFLNSLKDKDEWEDAPFTGPRAIVKHKCEACFKAAQEIVKLKLALIEKGLLIESLQEKRKPGRPRKDSE